MNNKVIISILILVFLVSLKGYSQEKKDALALYRQGFYKEAIEVCKQELIEAPRRKDAYVVIGWSLLALNRYEEALAYAKSGLKIDPNDFRIVKIAGEALFNLGKNEEALLMFQKYIRLNPNANDIGLIYYFMGEIYIRREEFILADVALSTAVYHNPNNAEWWVKLGYCRERNEDYKWALDAYEQALKLNPSLNDAVRGKERVRVKLSGG